MNNENPHAYMVQGKPKVNTPKAFKINTRAIKELFPKYNYTLLLEILFSVNSFTRFLDTIIHYQHKYSKNINPHELSNVINWYLTPENIEAACSRILERMSEIDLLKIYQKDKSKVHSSSDGQKFATSKESLKAYSY